MHEAIDALSESRRKIMLCIKHRGGATIAELAAYLGISDEGTRQHLIQLERLGWVVRSEIRDSGGRSGRPASVYSITDSGESLFPKRYPDLAVALVDAVGEMYGREALVAALSRIVDEQVHVWETRLAGKSFDERVALLKSYYASDDDFTAVHRDGRVSIEERNCPYLSVALARPVLCSVTVNVFTRLLGCEVRRRRRFQNGDGCCEFEVLRDRPVGREGLEFELEESAKR